MIHFLNAAAVFAVLLATPLMAQVPSPIPAAAQTAQESQPVSISELGSRFKLIGKLGVPLGEVATVEGVIVQGPSKGWEDGPNLRVQRIAGRATQEDIQIKVGALYGDPPALESGKTYRMEGYEDGGYVGTPPEAHRRAGLMFQTSNHYFQTRFVAYKVTPMEPIQFSPSDFNGQEAILQGTARTRGNYSMLERDGWSILVDSRGGWPAHVEGRLIETYGSYEPHVGQPTFSLHNGTWRLVRLDDQVGMNVALRAQAYQKNDDWWFEYRGPCKKSCVS